MYFALLSPGWSVSCQCQGLRCLSQWALRRQCGPGVFPIPLPCTEAAEASVTGALHGCCAGGWREKAKSKELQEVA